VAADSSSASNNKNNNIREAKVAAFRCAGGLLKCVSRLPSRGLTVADDTGATGLFATMLGDGTDPLQQLGPLDAVAKEFGKLEAESVDTMEAKVEVESESGSGGESWLSSPRSSRHSCCF